jgi:hypothetical protein
MTNEGGAALEAGRAEARPCDGKTAFPYFFFSAATNLSAAELMQ